MISINRKTPGINKLARGETLERIKAKGFFRRIIQPQILINDFEKGNAL
jgi:hypothetical protein